MNLPTRAAEARAPRVSHFSRGFSAFTDFVHLQYSFIHSTAPRRERPPPCSWRFVVRLLVLLFALGSWLSPLEAWSEPPPEAPRPEQASGTVRVALGTETTVVVAGAQRAEALAAADSSQPVLKASVVEENQVHLVGLAEGEGEVLV